MHQGLRSHESIPNRWLYCPRISNGVIGETFLAFKTPLSSDYSSQMPIGCTFMPHMLFEYCKRLNLKLGLWIDLTYTNRYYDKKMIEANGVQYVKMQCRGHNEVPSIEQTDTFIEIVDKFLENRPTEIVGVHCTHGFNRTGFLIVSYLVDRINYSVCDALQFFAKARPPGIYKQSYIDELCRRYNEDDVPIAPDTPDWSMSSNTVETNSYSEHRPSSSKVAANFQLNNKVCNNLNQQFDESKQVMDNPKPSTNAQQMQHEDCQFMDNVPGVTCVKDKTKIADLRILLKNLTKCNNMDFPGCQPVSMDEDNINLLRMEAYMVSWKADGIRYMMLIKGPKEIYFIDRKYAFYEVSNITFPMPGDLKNHLHNTIIDGEMVLDNNSGQKIPRFLIFDIVTYCDEDVGSGNLPARLKYVHKIVEARTLAIHYGLINRSEEPFGIRKKEFYDISLSHYLLSQFPKKLLHKLDGLLYQPRDDGYKMGVCDKILKWKPPELNTIDFLLKIKQENKPGCIPQKIGVLYVDYPNLFPIANITEIKSIKHLDNKIVECYHEDGKWKVLRERTDKLHPNSYKTAESIKKSILRPVKQNYLLQFIDAVKNEKKHFTNEQQNAIPDVSQQHSQRDGFKAVNHKHPYHPHPYQNAHDQSHRKPQSQTQPQLQPQM